MAQNIEIKARLDDIKLCTTLAANLADSEPQQLQQADTFFNCTTGKLKLREIEGQSAQLIAYSRAETSGPKLSRYQVYPCANPVLLKNTLSQSNGILGMVKKHRQVYLVGRTRIHIDQVEGLGDFMELEVTLADQDSVSQGQQEAEVLMQQLQIQPEQLIKVAYFNLLYPSL